MLVFGLKILRFKIRFYNVLVFLEFRHLWFEFEVYEIKGDVDDNVDANFASTSLGLYVRLK